MAWVKKQITEKTERWTDEAVRDLTGAWATDRIPIAPRPWRASVLVEGTGSVTIGDAVCEPRVYNPEDGTAYGVLRVTDRDSAGLAGLVVTNMDATAGRTWSMLTPRTSDLTRDVDKLPVAEWGLMFNYTTTTATGPATTTKMTVYITYLD